jgi:hypothetical protein
MICRTQIATPRGWNPHGHYLPHNAGQTQALNLADLGNGVPGPHGAGNVRLPQPQRKPGRADRRGPAVPAASVSNWASASSSKRSRLRVLRLLRRQFRYCRHRFS